ncbi:MAG: hypothetical protein LBP59_11235 [Planctomycetaceae bacterium]|jgi:hypothetical protein|nr:hypothetical protein [Planctomycetaceae bacterium]
MEIEIDAAHFEIDSDNLAEEWVNHPQRVYNYTAKAANARMRYEEAKRQEEVLRADTSLEIRKNPESYGLTKVTEGLIEAALLADDAVKAAAQHVIRCKYDLDIVTAAINALESKKKGLECLVQLHVTAYYAAPNDKSAYKERNCNYEHSREDRMPIPGIKPKVITNGDEILSHTS